MAAPSAPSPSPPAVAATEGAVWESRVLSELEAERHANRELRAQLRELRQQYSVLETSSVGLASSLERTLSLLAAHVARAAGPGVVSEAESSASRTTGDKALMALAREDGDGSLLVTAVKGPSCTSSSGSPACMDDRATTSRESSETSGLSPTGASVDSRDKKGSPTLHSAHAPKVLNIPSSSTISLPPRADDKADMENNSTEAAAEAPTQPASTRRGTLAPLMEGPCDEKPARAQVGGADTRLSSPVLSLPEAALEPPGFARSSIDIEASADGLDAILECNVDDAETQWAETFADAIDPPVYSDVTQEGSSEPGRSRSVEGAGMCSSPDEQPAGAPWEHTSAVHPRIPGSDEMAGSETQAEASWQLRMEAGGATRGGCMSIGLSDTNQRKRLEEGSATCSQSLCSQMTRSTTAHKRTALRLDENRGRTKFFCADSTCVGGAPTRLVSHRGAMAGRATAGGAPLLSSYVPSQSLSLPMSSGLMVTEPPALHRDLERHSHALAQAEARLATIESSMEHVLQTVPEPTELVPERQPQADQRNAGRPRLPVVHEVVRNKAERARMPANYCPGCEGFYDACKLPDDMRRCMHNGCSRHRSYHARIDTPESFWSWSQL